MKASARFPSWLIPVLLAALTLALYWPVAGHEFVDYDDPLYVTANTQVQAGLTWSNVEWAFSTGCAANWHPLTWLSLMLDVTLFGAKAGAMHLTNVGFHAANVVLLFWWLRRLTGAPWRSAWVAAVFAVHPAHVESVAWVAERKDVLSTFFGFVALIFYTIYAQNTEFEFLKSPIKRSFYLSPLYWLAWLALALGLMSKPMLVTWPFLFLLVDYWPLNRWQPGRASPLLREKIPFFILVLAASAVTFVVQKHGGAVATMESLPWEMRGENALVAWCLYVGKIFWPVNLAVFYPQHGYWPPGIVFLAALFLVGFSISLWVRRKPEPFLLAGWLWFVGALVPVIGLVQVGDQAMADRYTYIPSVGLFVFVAWGAGELTGHWRFQRLFLGAIGITTIGICLVLTRHQLEYWQNSETLFRHALAVTQNNATAHNNLGTALDNQGRVDEAMDEFQAALEIKPNNAATHYNLGNVLAKEGQTAAAISQFQEAIRFNPDDADTHNNLGSLLSKTGQTAAAIDQFQEVLRRQPDNAGAHFNLGGAFLKMGQIDEAVSEFQDVIQFTPDYAPGHYNLGVALDKKGEVNQAVTQFREAIRLQPDYAIAHNSLGIALAAQGQLDEAIREFQEAIRLKPDYASAQNNLARALQLRK